MMTLILPMPPSANSCWRQWQGRTLVSAGYRNFKKTVALKCLRIRPLDGALSVTLNIYRDRKTGDIDNRIKPVFDALNGIAWTDDKQIVELHVFRWDDKFNPRVEVTVVAK